MAYQADDQKLGFLRKSFLILVGIYALVEMMFLRPGLFMRNMKAVFGRDDTLWLTRPENAHRVKFIELETVASEERAEEINQLVYELVEDQDWFSLADMLEEWDDTRAACENKWRLIHIGVHAAVECFYQGVSEYQKCIALKSPRIGSEVMDSLLAAQAQHPHSRGLATLSARYLLSQSWDLRGQGWADSVSDAAWDQIYDNIQRADEILTVCEAAHPGSPLLTNTRLRMLRLWPEDTGALRFDWFEAAMRADPGDASSIYQIGDFLLPRWGGSYQVVETVARQAAAWSSETMGMGAYAALYNAAMEVEPEVILAADIDLYCEAVRDLVVYHGCDAAHIPEVAQLIMGASHLVLEDELEGADLEEWLETRSKLYHLSLSLLEDYLPGIHAPSWRYGLEGALGMISRAMGKELEEGMNLLVGPRGIQAVAPEDDV